MHTWAVFRTLICMANLYLMYDHYEEEGDTTFYYFRAGLFHGTALDDWLLLSTGMDDIPLLSMPSLPPAMIADGTTVQAPGGSTYEIPEDIYLCQIQFSLTASPVSNPLADYLANGLAAQPIVVYCSLNPYTYPDDYAPSDKAPNYGDTWYIPTLSLSRRTVASKNSASPFWTRADFSLWGAYGDNEYTCTGLPYQIHCTCNPGAYTLWISPASFRGLGYWQESGYYRDVVSQETTYMGQSIDYPGGNPYACDVFVYSPADIDDPVIWYNLRPPEFFDIIAPVAAGLFSILHLIAPGGFTLAKIPQLSGGYSYFPLGSATSKPLGSATSKPLGGKL